MLTLQREALASNNPIKTSDDFDVIALETQLEKAYQAKIQPYTDIEVDATYDFGNYSYRVWSGHRCLGTFYRSLDDDSQWIAEAFYKNGRFSGTPEAKFNTSKLAQNYIVKSYLG